MTIRVLGYVMARNEWPLLGLAVTHGFNCGLDHIVVVDHASVDETAAGLKRLKSKWPGRLTVIHLELDDFLQEATTRAVMSLVGADAYDWVYVFDADEFALTPGNVSLRDLLGGVAPDVDVLRYELQQWVAPHDMNDLDPAQYLRINEKALPCVFLDQPPAILEQQIKDGHLNFFDLPFPSKVIVRGRHAHKLFAGAHKIVGERNLIEKKVPAALIRVGHLPLLSLRRVKLKSLQGESLSDANFPQWHGWQNQMIYRLDVAGELDVFWQNHSTPKSLNHEASSAPTTVIDDAICNALKKAVRVFTAVDEIKIEPAAEQQVTDQFKLDSLVLCINEFMNQLASFNQSVAERDVQVARLDAELQEEKEKLTRVLSSNSWRLTRPIRELRRWLQKGRRFFVQGVEGD